MKQPEGDGDSVASKKPSGSGSVRLQPNVLARGWSERPAWMRRERFWHDAAMWSALAFVTVGALVGLGWAYFSGEGMLGALAWLRGREQVAPSVVVAPSIEPQATRLRLIDGTPLVEGSEECDYVAVMVDNLTEARPPAGLSRAALVFSAPVEAAITRFLAFYPTDVEARKIGPVRSARPYYLDWASELDALYVHVGGSPEALDKIKRMDLRDLNQFYWGDRFWRDHAREAPHNVYTSTQLLSGYLKSKSAECRLPSASVAWRFKSDADPEERPAEVPDLEISHRTDAYAVTWRYDRNGNAYRRMQGFVWHKDDDGTLIVAKNVAVLFAKVTVLDDVGRRRIDTVGSGAALVVQDGRVIEGTWRKASVEGRTRFYDAAGREIEFNAGPTWVEVVPIGTVVSR